MRGIRYRKKTFLEDHPRAAVLVPRAFVGHYSYRRFDPHPLIVDQSHQRNWGFADHGCHFYQEIESVISRRIENQIPVKSRQPSRFVLGPWNGDASSQGYFPKYSSVERSVHGQTIGQSQPSKMPVEHLTPHAPQLMSMLQTIPTRNCRQHRNSI